MRFVHEESAAAFALPTKAVHPQLRDLLIAPPDSVATLCDAELTRHHFDSPRSTQRLPFAPTSLSSNFGLIAFGSQSGDIALSTLPSHSHSPSIFELQGDPRASINNSLCFTASPLSSTPLRLLVSTNDETIDSYAVVGDIPDYTKSRRRREKRRRPSLPPPLEWPDDEDESEQYALSASVRLEKVGKSIKLGTPVNHTSVSSDGRYLVSVGDDNLIRLFSAGKSSGEFTLVKTIKGSEDASFSTDWSKNSLSFAVGSQDGVVNVFDVRNLSSLDTTMPRRLATIPSAQRGQASAIRKIKFSSTECGSEILAFTEHRSVLQVVSTTQYDSPQIINVPASSPTTTPSPRSISYSPPSRQHAMPPPIISPRLSLASQAHTLSQNIFDRIDRNPPERSVADLTANLTTYLTTADLSAYQPIFQYSSAYFPEDHSTEDDLLGMDFDEWGETLFVATNQRVWSYRVDADAQRRSETFSTR